MKTAEFLRKAAETVYSDQEASVSFRTPDSRPSYIDEELGDALQDAFCAELNGNSQGARAYYIEAGLRGKGLYESTPTLKITASQRKERALNGAVGVISLLAGGEIDGARILANDILSDTLVPTGTKAKIQEIMDQTTQS